jgi:hypothetical protein
MGWGGVGERGGVGWVGLGWHGEPHDLALGHCERMTLHWGTVSRMTLHWGTAS